MPDVASSARSFDATRAVAFEGSCALVFEAELVVEGVDDGLDRFMVKLRPVDETQQKCS